MSFLGSIGMFIRGSGLSDALSTIYGTNAVEHMSGKAMSQAICGHFLVESALTSKVILNFVEDDDGEKDDNHDDDNDNDDNDDHDDCAQDDGKQSFNDHVVAEQLDRNMDVPRWENWHH